MTIGWGWGRTGSGRGSNKIVANLIERPTTVRCCDGASWKLTTSICHEALLSGAAVMTHCWGAGRQNLKLTFTVCGWQSGGGIYTLGPQPGSSLSRNYLINHDAPLGGSNCIYHDNGSGGFTDSENVCEGEWNNLAINGNLGSFGPCGVCPSFEPGVPPNCSIVASGNWFQTKRGAKHTESGEAHVGCDQVHEGPNVQLKPGEPLPAAAAAVAAAAGPRY